MKVKLRHLVPNPFRDMDNYPINREKIENLKNSIETTGFWDNILGRVKDNTLIDYPNGDGIHGFLENDKGEMLESNPEGGYPNYELGRIFDIEEADYIEEEKYKEYLNGGIQIAYGHHRLIALQELFDDDHEVDVTVRDLSDWDMLLIMGNENRDTYKNLATATLETVKQVRMYLEEKLNTKVIDQSLIDLLGLDARHTLADIKTKGVGQTTILKFLNGGKEKGSWKQWEIQSALNTLDDKTITNETVKKIGDGSSLNNFKAATSEMSKEQKEELATDIEELELGKRSIKPYVEAIKTLDAKSESHHLSDAENAIVYTTIKQKFAKGESVNTDEVTAMVMEKAYPTKAKTKPIEDKSIIKFTEFLVQTMGEIDLLNKRIYVLKSMRKELTNYTYDSYVEKVSMMLKVERLRNELTILMEDVKQDISENVQSKNLLNK